MASLIETSSPWASASDGQHWTEAFHATGPIDALAFIEGRDGEPWIVDDGLVCLLFDD